MSAILGNAGEKRLLLGNEAIARGVIEAGVGFASAYPGTPSTEAMDALRAVAKKVGIYVEYATNEIIAYESAFSACLAGVRSFFAAKHVGINVAADAIATSGYVGTRAGFVFLDADDPNCHSSQNEQDNRNLARHYGLLLLEPSNPQEAKQMVIYGYNVSEKVHQPVMLRTTTRISHARAPVEFGPIPDIKTKGFFEKDPSRFVVIPANARRNHAEMLKRLKEAQELSEASEWNVVYEFSGDDPSIGRFGIISSSVAFSYAYEEFQKMNLSGKILKLGFSYPLPEKKIVKFLETLDHVLIVEELDPILERDIRAIAQMHDLNTKIYGKNILPRLYEFAPEIVEKGILVALGKEKGPVSPINVKPVSEISGVHIPTRPPVLCPACPHRASYYAIKRALLELKVNPKKVIYSTDIGCMTLGVMPPYLMGDVLFCMGSSIGASGGLSQVTDQPVMAFIGDSTFFHAGLPGLANAIYNKHPMMIVVLDNNITAMTGFQPDPRTGLTAMSNPTKKIDIEKIAKALGADFAVTVDQIMNWKDAKDKFKEAYKVYQQGGVSVVVFKHPCAIYERHTKGYAGLGGLYEIDAEKCINCGICYKDFNCPAIVYDSSSKKPLIRADVCLGCGVCMQICPVQAIYRIQESRK